MTGSNKSVEPEAASPRESGEDSEDDLEILEESPCGRWSKRRQEVQQRDVPGIDVAYLAMDTEEGMEVVWNEVRFSERRTLREREEVIKAAFNSLTELDHPNIVKLHNYWLDSDPDKRRIVFITEYMSSGSLRKFLKLTKRNDKKVHISSWKKWCIQILSALGYLHSCSPSIVHGNLTVDTIFIQSNGLIKIGSVAPDAIQSHVKTCKADMKNMHYIAPEYADGGPITSSVDVYSLGMCVLEMAALEISGNGDSGHCISKELISKTIDSLENLEQRDFIRQCLESDPSKRPGVRQLLLHPVLFEVHSLKLLTTHVLLNMPNDQYSIEEILQHQYSNDAVVAEVRGRGSDTPLTYTLANINNTDKLEKFVEDVRYGVYPLTAFGIACGRSNCEESGSVSSSPHTQRRGADQGGNGAGSTHVDTRVTNMMCNIKPHEDGQQLHLTISLRLDNKMNRQLSCLVSPTDEANTLTDELVMHAFIAKEDHANVCTLIEEHLRQARLQEPITKLNNTNNNNGGGGTNTSNGIINSEGDHHDNSNQSSAATTAATSTNNTTTTTTTTAITSTTNNKINNSNSVVNDEQHHDHVMLNGNCSPQRRILNNRNNNNSNTTSTITTTNGRPPR
uniref:Nuclear receptor-binding protein homolog n=1 Tax=Hirondellea gigas TaxID=1518452 RepID=A0A2P2HYL5_9CRUS